MTESIETKELIARLDGSGSSDERAAVAALKQLETRFPVLMTRAYKAARSASARSACLFYSIAYAREDPAAVELASLALLDRSRIVRYRALMLLAWSQAVGAHDAVLAFLERNPSDGDGLAAMDALVNKNPNYFVDRQHTGNITLVI